MSQYPFSYYFCGTYTNAESGVVAQNIALPAKPDRFQVTDTTNWGLASTAVGAMQSFWLASMPAGSYLQLDQTSVSAGTVNLYSAQGTSGGFTYINQASPPTFSKVAITAINGTTGVVSTGTTTGISVGDTVRLINVTGALQLSGTLYTVTAVSAGVSITLGMIATAVTAGAVIANGTTGFYQKVYAGNFVPNTLPVLYVTKASQGVVYFGRPNPYTVGELVDFQVPTAYGMTQLSNLTGNSGSGALTSNPSGAARVLAVTNTATNSSITIDLSTSGFTSFTLPTSANYAAGASPAVCIPAGSGIVPLNGSATIPQSPPGTNLLDAFDNQNQFIMNVGTSVVGAASAVMFWEAWKSDGYNAITNA